MVFCKEVFLTSDSIIEYISTVLRQHPLITEYIEAGEEYDEKGEYIEGNWHLEHYFKMVPYHFHFVIMDDNWDDKMYRFSFLTDDNRMLRLDEDQTYHKEIESICWDANQKISAIDLNMKILPSDMHPSAWTEKDMEMIYRRVNSPIILQTPKLVHQK